MQEEHELLREKKRYSWIVWLCVAGGLLILGIVVGSTGKNGGSDQTASNANSVIAITSQPIEYQLAFINSGYTAPSETTVTRFRFLLSQLRSESGYSDKVIGNLMVLGVNTLHDKYGKDVRLLDFTETIQGLMSTEGHTTLGDTLAAYTTLYGYSSK